MTKKPTFREIADALRVDPEPFATTVIGEEPSYRTGSQVRYFENQSLVVFTSGSAQGRYKWFGDDEEKGDMLDLFTFQRGGTKHEAIEFAKGYLGLGDGAADLSKLPKGPTDEERRREQEEKDAQRVRTARWLWNQASETEGRDEGLAYLRGRGITCDIPATTLRFRRLSRDNLEKMGVEKKDMPDTPVVSLLFAARNPEGEITAVQQILTTEGKKVTAVRPDFPNPKRTNGIMEGSAVWLGDPKGAEKAALVEGPETGCSIYQATGLPTCVALGTSNFTSVSMPDGLRELVVAADMERSGVGLASALRTAQSWSDRGVERASVALPLVDEGDFNDTHQRHGEAEVKRAVEGAFAPAAQRRDGTVLVTADARAAFWAWRHTGVEVAPHVPGKDKDGAYRPMSVDRFVGEEHNRVLLVKTRGIEMRTEELARLRPDVEVVTLHEDSKKFREVAKRPGEAARMIANTDLHAPRGIGTTEPVFFSLRRADAEALDLDGHRSVALRTTAIEKADLGFMAGREAIVAPIGNGTRHDEALTRKLEEAGAKTTRLTWQIFRGDGDLAIVRREVPENFGAADAAREGWTGKALGDLVQISKANQRQMARRSLERASVDPSASAKARRTEAER